MKLEIQSIPNHPLVSFVGPGLKEGVLPALIYFALSKEDSLSLDPFNQPVQFLQGKPLRAFSFTIPCHLPGQNKMDAMKCWADNLKKNKNFLLDFIQECSNEVDFLVKENIIDPKFIAVSGLSRGGFLATHLAAKNEKINTVLGFSPLTNLKFLHEFASELEDDSYSLNHLKEKLIHKSLRFYIGNHDTRIGTKNCFEFIEELTSTAYQNKVRSPQVELVIFPSIGHKGHGTPPHIFEEGIEWLLKKFAIST